MTTKNIFFILLLCISFLSAIYQNVHSKEIVITSTQTMYHYETIVQTKTTFSTYRILKSATFDNREFEKYEYDPMMQIILGGRTMKFASKSFVKFNVGGGEVYIAVTASKPIKVEVQHPYGSELDYFGEGTVIKGVYHTSRSGEHKLWLENLEDYMYISVLIVDGRTIKNIITMTSMSEEVKTIYITKTVESVLPTRTSGVSTIQPESVPIHVQTSLTYGAFFSLIIIVGVVLAILLLRWRTTPPKVEKCERCGTILPADAEFCDECGYKL